MHPHYFVNTPKLIENSNVLLGDNSLIVAANLVGRTMTENDDDALVWAMIHVRISVQCQAPFRCLECDRSSTPLKRCPVLRPVR